MRFIGGENSWQRTRKVVFKQKFSVKPVLIKKKGYRVTAPMFAPWGTPQFDVSVPQFANGYFHLPR